MVVLVSGLCATAVGWILALGLMRMNGPADKGDARHRDR
jgi:hypothetical protein